MGYDRDIKDLRRVYMICHPEIKNRLKRASGQMNGVITMMDKGATCEDILNQLKAIKSSIEKAIGLLTTTNLIQKIEAKFNVEVKDVDDAIDLVMKGI
jgi:DNA-binding FrmR family transcriptional regulator